MAIHIVGFGVGGSLYQVARTTGLVLIVATAALPWVAVIVANSLPRRRRPRPTHPRRSLFAFLQLGDIVGGERHLGDLHVLLQVREARGTGDQQDVVAVRE